MFVTWFSLCCELFVKCIVWALHLVVVVVVVVIVSLWLLLLVGGLSVVLFAVLPFVGMIVG